MIISSNSVDAHEAASDLASDWCVNILGHEPRVKVRNISQGWEGCELQVGHSFDASALLIGGVEYSHGFCTHADSEFEIVSTVPITRFQAIVGLDQNLITMSATKLATRIIFSVEVGGHELWCSEAIGIDDSGVRVDLTLPPSTTALSLKARYTGAVAERGHADWAATWAELADGSRLRLGITRMPDIPFSFSYGGQSSRDFLHQWQKTIGVPQISTHSRLHGISWSDPETGLEVRMELTEFTDYPVIEWVLHFRNTGLTDTPILTNIQSLDCEWGVQRPMHENIAATIYRSRGSTFRISDFEYVEDMLLLNESLHMGGGGGRTSQYWMPFFNTDLGDKGIITAIGWSGQWACSLEHRSSGLRMCAGYEHVHLKLLPGEEIRSPRMAQLFWKGNRIASHNVWRRFLLHHHTPQTPDGPITGPFTIAHWGGMNTQGHLDRVAVYRRERIPQEYLWIDAGWYGVHSEYSPDEFLGDWGRHTGDWRVNPRAHPNGLRPIVDAAREAGMKFLLWAEPERAIEGTIWVDEHPDWFLGQGDQRLLNLGNPDAFRGVLDFTSQLIKENDVAIYRVDFNIDPLDFWRNNDAPDRQGITEIRYNEGLYAFWDALLERHPGLIIDNCASGGRRIDLETISRSIVLWRSDYSCFGDYDPVGAQTQGLGLSYWIPLHGTGTWGSMPTKELCSTYRVRSTMGPAFHFSAFMKESQPIQEDYPWDWHRRMGAEYLRARPFFIGDYYPLTSHATSDPRQWAAYQMDRPDLGEGFVMAFRRKDAPWGEAVYGLHGLDAAATYELENADTSERVMVIGRDLTEGLKINLPERESSALYFYRRS